MKKLTLYISLLFVLTCAKEDSQDPGTTPSNITPRYTLTASAGEGGSVSPTTGSFNAGTQVSVTATPNSGYQFTSWSNGSTENPLSVALNSNTSITANFEVLINSYTLTVVSTDGGSVTGAGEYNEGTEVTLTATASDGYRFTGWSDGSTAESVTITLNSDTSITANFETVSLIELIVNPGYGGSVSSFGGEYYSGQTINLTAIPDIGFEFAYWRNNKPTIYQFNNNSELEFVIDESILPPNQTYLDLTATFIPKIEENFVSMSPNYEYPNSTVGQINTSYWYPGIYLTPEYINHKIAFPNNDMFNGNYNIVGTRESAFFDFDNNGKLDFFGFMVPSTSVYFDGGKTVLVKDFFSEQPTTTFFDSNVSFPTGTEVNDFNGDGIEDLLWYYSNDHQIYDSNNNEIYAQNLPLEIYYFSSDGNYNVTQISPPASIHDLTSGDIDNDGDIDIIFGTYKQNLILQDLENGFPYILLNDGFGNFTLQNSYERFVGLEELFEEYNCSVCAIMNLLTIELFDINNDGILDLFVGNNFNNFDTHLFNPEKPRIYLGMDNGYFDLNNFIEIPLIDINTNESLTINGVIFIDAKNDGFYDIIINANGNNQNAYQFIENNNLTFENVTIDKFNSFYEERTQSFCEDCLPGFYQFRPYDKDNDGDFDLVPSGLRIIWQYGEDILDTPNNIYWENIGGQFIKKIN